MTVPLKKGLEAWADALLVFASALLQEQRKRYLEEWYALLEDVPTPLAKFGRALSLSLAAVRMAREASWRRRTSYAVPFVIRRAPGRWLMKVSRVVLPKRIYHQVVVPLFSDCLHEYFHPKDARGQNLPLCKMSNASRSGNRMDPECASQLDAMIAALIRYVQTNTSVEAIRALSQRF